MRLKKAALVAYDAAAMGTMAFWEVLDRAVQSAWRRRTQRELLLDLGERKRWGEDEHREAVRSAAAWLVDALLLPATLDIVPSTMDGAALEAIRPYCEDLAPGSDLQGVARWIVGVAPALGVAPKTLANSLEGGLQSHRADHRWLQLIARALRDEAAPDAWAFHRRSPSAVAHALACQAGRSVLDAGDAVLLASLLALWQRRRPTSEARGSRGHSGPRRETPKPIAALRGSLVSPGQLRHLTRLAGRLAGAPGKAVLLVALEAALTEAHLASHPARRSRREPREGGESWLRAVDSALEDAVALLGDEEALVLRFRVDRMRAWGGRRPQPDSAFAGVRSPYVCASLALERAHQGLPPTNSGFDPHTPGLLMLLPLLKRRDLLVNR